jgi:hypothetical protein
MLSLRKNNSFWGSDYPFPSPENPVKRSDLTNLRKSDL